MIGALLLTLALAAGGSGELMELIERANQAEVTGRQLAITYAEEGISSEMYQVVLTGGMAMAETATGQTMAGGGNFYKDSNTAAAMPISVPAGLHAKYEVEIMEADSDTAALISESGAKRAWFLFDGQSGAVTVRETFDDQGEPYRVEVFMPNAYEYSMPAADDMPEPEMMSKTARSLPDVPGYEFTGEFAVDDGGSHGVYRDGLFRVSVFTFESGSAIAGSDSFYEAEFAGEDGYRRSYGPPTTRITWQAANATYLVVGDAPPDHLEDFVSPLPKPASQNWFARLWRSIFG